MASGVGYHDNAKSSNTCISPVSVGNKPSCILPISLIAHIEGITQILEDSVQVHAAKTCNVLKTRFELVQEC